MTTPERKRFLKTQLFIQFPFACVAHGSHITRLTPATPLHVVH
jgi:hypothetical protein